MMPHNRFDEASLDLYLDIKERCFRLCSIHEQLCAAKRGPKKKETDPLKVVEKGLSESYEREITQLAVEVVDFSEHASADLLNAAVKSLPHAVMDDLKGRLGVTA